MTPHLCNPTACGRLRQEDCLLKDGLGYIVGSEPPWEPPSQQNESKAKQSKTNQKPKTKTTANITNDKIKNKTEKQNNNKPF